MPSFENGYIKTNFFIPSLLKTHIHNKDWKSVDKEFQILTSSNGALFNFLKTYCEFHSIEFIISLRDSENEWEEDGIWHDDGSRKMAFSLSLMNHVSTQGGVLEIRKKGSDKSQKILPFDFGQIVIFKTGSHNFEHKINAVTHGQRLIIAGWCS